MKTLKIIAIALMAWIVSASFAQTEKPYEEAPPGPAYALVIPLNNAMQVPEFVKAIQVQVSPRILEAERPRYTEPVRFHHRVYFVTGTYAEWRAFFSHYSKYAEPIIASNLIPLEKAMHNAPLVQAMRAQLTTDMISVEKPLYIAPVRYKHTIVYVSGNYEAWKKFFHIHSDITD